MLVRQRILIVFTCLFLISCVREMEDGPEVQTRDMVTCTVNGQQWMAGTDSSMSVIDEVISAEYGVDAGQPTLSLTAWHVEGGKATSIGIYAPGVKLGENVRLDGKIGRGTYTEQIGKEKPSFLTTDIAHAGELHLTGLDTARKRIKGTFHFSVEGVVINAGEFDTRYTTPLPL